jgi:hypothetical protein
MEGHKSVCKERASNKTATTTAAEAEVTRGQAAFSLSSSF